MDLILCLVPTRPCDTMHSMLSCSPHPSPLVAYNGGTNIGHGPITTLFLSLIMFPVPAQ